MIREWIDTTTILWDWCIDEKGSFSEYAYYHRCHGLMILTENRGCRHPHWHKIHHSRRRFWQRAFRSISQHIHAPYCSHKRAVRCRTCPRVPKCIRRRCNIRDPLERCKFHTFGRTEFPSILRKWQKRLERKWNVSEASESIDSNNSNIPRPSLGIEMHSFVRKTKLTYWAIAVHPIFVGLVFRSQNARASGKIGFTKAARRIPGTLQVAGFLHR